MKTLPARLALFAALTGAGASAQEMPSPALLVLLKGERAMVIVDPASGKEVGRVAVGQDPHELAVSTDGKLAFGSNYSGPAAQGSNSLSVIDLATRKEVHHVEMGPLSRPHGLWFADGKLYFTAEGSMAIGRYDPAARQVDWILGTGQDRTHMILVGKDRKIFTSNVSSNSISIIEKATPPRAARDSAPLLPAGRAGRLRVGRAGHPQARRRSGLLLAARAGPLGAGRPGSRRWSGSAGGRRGSTSRRMARRSGRPRWATARFR